MSDLPAEIAAVIDATNRGDSEAFVAAFAPDGVVSDWGKEFVGSEAIAEWDSTDNIGRSSHIEVVAAEPHGATWRVAVEVSGQGFNGTSEFAFTVRDGRVARLEITP